VCVTISLINALAVVETTSDIVILLGANGMIITMILIMDRQLSLEHENFKEINYERIDLIKPELREQMIDDLRNRTGLPIHRIEIIKLDFLRDVARINAFYYAMENESTSVGVGDDD
jgi:hypothetical protein